MRIPFTTLAIFALALESHGALTFNFNYTDAGTGFNDPTFGTDRRNALSSAASTLASWYPSYTAEITVTVSSYVNAESLTLASASSPFGASVPGFKNNVMRGKILSNGASDINGASSDASVSFNFGHSWNLTDTADPGSYDFKAVTLHEFTHAMGFVSYLESNGTGLINPARPSGDQDVWSIFDQFLTDAAGNRIVTTDFRYNTTLGLTPLTADPGLYFSGPNAMAAYGGRVPIYSPNPFSSGSSAGHLDADSLAGLGTLLMYPAMGTGLGSRQLSAIEMGIMEDLGYAVVPEPELAALATGGLAWAWGLWIRRRQR